MAETHKNPGDELRDHAANLLSIMHGPVSVEFRALGKKSDIFFTRKDYGREQRVYVEAKDYARPLTRQHVVEIWTDYSGIIAKNEPSILLLVTRNGLSPDALTFVEQEQRSIRHQTIWNLDDQVLSLNEYVRSLQSLYDENGLNSYYQEAYASPRVYDRSHRPIVRDTNVNLFNEVQQWISNGPAKPLAILGGYGAGKSSLAKRLVAHQAKLCVDDPTARKPILIRLGVFTGHTRIEGVLGAMFTYDFPVASFNTHRFLEMNRRGRLLVILDGFDEMKHAMTFSDFRAQLSELNKLVDGDARIILLGRPNAFISNEEHVYVLRGRAKFGKNDWRRLPDWPEFSEYELQEFGNAQRTKFIQDYLSYLSRTSVQSFTDEWVEERARQIQNIAEADPAVYNKPVHAKILTSLGADSTIDISTLVKDSTRWRLYDLVFSSLTVREVKKDARRPIKDEFRLKFLRDVAHWLWSEKNGATSFSAFELPHSILDGLPDGESSDHEGKTREYLSGSFLEKKAGDTYYFSHRSFAEFLVASWMIANQPLADAHLGHSRLAKDGVADFLLDNPEREAIRKWASSLHEATVQIDLAYLDFLRRACGGKNELRDTMHSTSRWRRFISIFTDSITLDNISEEALFKLMRAESDVDCMLAIVASAYRYFGATRTPTESIPLILAKVIAALLDKLFAKERHHIDYSSFRIPAAAAIARDVAAVSIDVTRNSSRVKVFRISFSLLLTEALNTLREEKIGFTVDAQLLIPDEREIPVETALSLMDRKNAEKANDYFLRHSDFSKFRVVD